MSLAIILAVVVVAVVNAAPQQMTQQWAEIQEALPVHQDTSLKFQSPFTDDWEAFKVKHNKLYESKNEEMHRFGIFIENLLHIEKHNELHDKGLKSYRLGINMYCDMSHEEFVKTMNGFKMNGNRTRIGASTYLSASPAVTLVLPTSMDWRKHGYVTPVKNQGSCGSCWSFSATGAIEGQHFRKTGKLISLSEQNLVDCSGKWGNNGCNGGLMDNAFRYVKDNRGLDTEKFYPYKGIEGTCRYHSEDVGATVSGLVDLPQGDEDKLKEASATIGPISIAIDASHRSFQLYHSGVYDEPECSSSQLDHGVLLVGYGTYRHHDYWLVKNSWSPTWGVDGYVMMARNKDNQCGVASQASYPLV